MRKQLAVTTALGLMTAGLTLPAAATAAPAGHQQPGWTPPPVTWGACAHPALNSRGAECGKVVVPLDYAKPTGTKISLAVSRIKHTTPTSQGVMLVNPGGPGGSGLVLSVLGEFVPDGAGAAYDWIGFDPRGVGASEPALSCDGDYFGHNRPPYVPTDPAIERAWLNKADGYAKACDAIGGALLDHLKTTDTVADMESIRKALGAPQINFYGYSYGTYLAQVYATRHPQRVRRMVLDGNVDPRKVWYQANLDQDIAFNRNIKVFFAWVARHDDVYHLGTSTRAVEATWYRVLAELRTAPAGGKIGPAEWTDVFVPAGYAAFLFPSRAEVFAAWVNDRDADRLIAEYDDTHGSGPGSDNGYAMYLAVQCTDAPWPTDWNRWRVDNWVTHVRAPFMTWSNAWYNAPCRNWGAKAGTPPVVDGAKAPPVLLISETYDAATPYEGSLEVRSRFPRSALIEGVGGTTHSGSLNGVACVDNAVAAYLTDGTLPARRPGRTSDLKCDPVPVPEPGGTDLRRSAPEQSLRQELHRLIGRY